MQLPKWAERLPIDLIKTTAEKAGIDWVLLAAIVQKESSGNPWALRYEPAWHYFHRVEESAQLLMITPETERQSQKFSYGLCQLMLSVARELGFTLAAGKLFEPEVNLYYGARKLKNCLARWVKHDDAVAAYNAGGPRRMADGSYVNSSYVNTVNALMRQLSGATTGGIS